MLLGSPVGRVRAAMCVLAGLLVLLVAGRIGWSVATLAAPGEVEFGEALIHDHAARLRRGEALYQSVYRPAFTVASYTPTYYVAVGGLQAVFGPGFMPGRLLSLFAGLGAAGLIGWLAARRAADRRAGVLGALVFIGLGLPGQHPWWTLYKEDVLALTWGLASTAVLYRSGGTRDVVVAALLAGLAVLTKQTYIAAGCAGWVWLVLRRDVRDALIYGLIGIALVGGVALALEVSTRSFFSNVIQANANPLSTRALAENLSVYARYQLGLVVVAVAGLIVGAGRIRRSRPDLLVIYWLASAVVPLVGMSKLGAFHNYWLELAATTSVLAAAGLWSLGARRSSLAAVCVLAVLANCAWALRASALPELARSGLVPSRQDVASFDRLVQRTRDERREVVADPPDVVVLAGRPILFEPWAMSLLYRQKIWGWDAAPLVSDICGGGVGLVVLGYPIETDGPQLQGMSRWAPPLIDALRAAMVRDLSFPAGERYIYVPRASPVGSGCGTS